jgi:hypothetical protein
MEKRMLISLYPVRGAERKLKNLKNLLNKKIKKQVILQTLSKEKKLTIL